MRLTPTLVCDPGLFGALTQGTVPRSSQLDVAVSQTSGQRVQWEPAEEDSQEGVQLKTETGKHHPAVLPFSHWNMDVKLEVVQPSCGREAVSMRPRQHAEGPRLRASRRAPFPRLRCPCFVFGAV